MPVDVNIFVMDKSKMPVDMRIMPLETNKTTTDKHKMTAACFRMPKDGQQQRA